MNQSTLKSADSKPGGKAKPWPPPVARHPATRELGRINRAVRRLSLRIRRFCDEHGRRCRCLLCLDVRAQRMSWPDLWEELRGLSATMWGLGGLAESDSPMPLEEYTRPRAW